MMNKVEIVNIVTEVFAQWDPMDLMDIVCIINEYHPEAVKVTKYIENEKPNVNDLGEYIKQVFDTYFNENFDLEECNQVANCILMNLE